MFVTQIEVVGLIAFCPFMAEVIVGVVTVCIVSSWLTTGDVSFSAQGVEVVKVGVVFVC